MTVEIQAGKITGNISPRVLNMVQEWRELHKDELIGNWKLAEENKPLQGIKPLERDYDTACQRSEVLA